MAGLRVRNVEGEWAMRKRRTTEYLPSFLPHSCFLGYFFILFFFSLFESLPSGIT